MSKPGIYSTVNDGLAWKRAESRGLDGEPGNLAVHPSNNKIVAAGTKAGLFLSTDSGDNFKRLASGEQVLAAFFDLDGKELWFSSYSGKPALTRLDWSSGKKTDVSLPPLTQDAVAYIAQNPAHRSEYAIATFERNVYVSKDQGRPGPRSLTEAEQRRERGAARIKRKLSIPMAGPIRGGCMAESHAISVNRTQVARSNFIWNWGLCIFRFRLALPGLPG